MRRFAFVLGLTVPLAGCGWISNTMSSVGGAFGFGGTGGMPFRASLDAGEDPRDVVVSVSAPAGVPLEDFRESARLPVTRYCLTTFGTSEAEWAADAATGDWAVVRGAETAQLQARCTGRA